MDTYVYREHDQTDDTNYQPDPNIRWLARLTGLAQHNSALPLLVLSYVLRKPSLES
jgi:hypothetical protein